MDVNYTCKTSLYYHQTSVTSVAYYYRKCSIIQYVHFDIFLERKMSLETTLETQFHEQKERHDRCFSTDGCIGLMLFWFTVKLT